MVTSGVGWLACSASVTGRLLSFREELRFMTDASLKGDSSSGGHLALVFFVAGLSVLVVVVLFSSGSVRGGHEIFSLRVSVGLSAFSWEPCPRASMVAVRTLTLARGESSTHGLIRSEV